MSTLATYYHDGKHSVHPCRPGEADGTVDLLDAQGEVIVRGCPVIDEEGPKLPSGCAVVEGEAPAKSPTAKKAAKKDKAAD